MGESAEAEQTEAANEYMVILNQVLDHVVVEVAKASEESAAWKKQS